MQNSKLLLALLLASLTPACGGHIDTTDPGANPNTGGAPDGGASSGGGTASGGGSADASAGATAVVSVAPGEPAAGGDAAVPVASVDASVVLVGSGSFTVMSDVPAGGGASYEQEASFSLQPACPTTTIGFCSIRQCSTTGSSPTALPTPDVGPIVFTGGQMTSDPLQPSSNETYAPVRVSGQSAWNTGGDPVTVQWAHFPGDPSQPGGSIQLTSPAYLVLSPSSAFASPTATWSRTQDVTLAWTANSPPSDVDQVLVDFSSGSTQISCSFGASASVGTVPAAVLQYLSAGPGTYDIHSKQYASQVVLAADGTPWQIAFNVDAHVQSSVGLTYGSITFE